MEVESAKAIVVLAGRKLLESGLIVRTWGNVSCRAGGSQFVITPSGRDYRTLTPDDMVTVDINTGSYKGKHLPSSEAGVHGEVYRRRKDVNFVIHTHQVYASVVSTLQRDIPLTNPFQAARLGDNIVCAPYALPGSKKLQRNVAAALALSGAKAFLLAHHGALCLGDNYEDGFQAAKELEKLCRGFLLERCSALTGIKNPGEEELGNFFLTRSGRLKSRPGKKPPLPLYNSAREGDLFKLYLTDKEGEEPAPLMRHKIDEPVPVFLARDENQPAGEAEIHRLIYKKYKHVNAILNPRSPDITAVSRVNKNLPPFLDDFAQMIGPGVKSSEVSRPGRIARILKGRSAALIKDRGALCCGPSIEDAEAAVIILDKNCKAVIACSLFDGAKPINPLDARLMRLTYLTSYSRKI